MPSETRAAPILCVVGARPNFVKIAPVIRAMRGAMPPLPVRLVHTGQHYDPELNSQFFEALEIPDPDINLEVGSGSHAVQTAEIMRRFEPILDRERPAAVLAVGDVNSTIACALVAAKKGVAVIHVEAGLRSFDRTMPEEINRVLTDQISELLFTTEQGARDNLLREGILASRIHFVGNVMIDTLRHNLEKAVPYTRTLGEHGARRTGRKGGSPCLPCTGLPTSMTLARYGPSWKRYGKSPSACPSPSLYTREQGPESTSTNWAACWTQHRYSVCRRSDISKCWD
jgi:UDP-N-acetylglucosamine 2-epimerase (non-hydrolysing)